MTGERRTRPWWARLPQPTHIDDGLRAALEIRERWPDTGVLVLSQYVQRRYAARLRADRPEGIGRPGG
ncbi:hypothetical protein [Micromonospora sp. NPDC005237]|uniref:hypothetical protein n=1 Tax=unclassified Micromonospora TaxID=2617518 RepID=UPI0033AF6E8E